MDSSYTKTLVKIPIPCLYLSYRRVISENHFSFHLATISKGQKNWSQSDGSGVHGGPCWPIDYSALLGIERIVVFCCCTVYWANVVAAVNSEEIHCAVLNLRSVWMCLNRILLKNILVKEDRLSFTDQSRDLVGETVILWSRWNL